MFVLSFQVSSIASPAFLSSKCQSTVGSEAALECFLVQGCGCEKLKSLNLKKHRSIVLQRILSVAVLAPPSLYSVKHNIQR